MVRPLSHHAEGNEPRSDKDKNKVMTNKTRTAVSAFKKAAKIHTGPFTAYALATGYSITDSIGETVGARFDSVETLRKAKDAANIKIQNWEEFIELVCPSHKGLISQQEPTPPKQSAATIARNERASKIKKGLKASAQPTAAAPGPDELAPAPIVETHETAKPDHTPLLPGGKPATAINPTSKRALCLIRLMEGKTIDEIGIEAAALFPSSQDAKALRGMISGYKSDINLFAALFRRFDLPAGDI